MEKSGWVQPWPSHEWATREAQIKEYVPKILTCLSPPLRYKSLQSCLTLGDPMNCSLLGFFVHGVLQARPLEWVAMPSSRGSSQFRNQTHVSCIGRWVLYHCIISAVTVRGNFCLWFSGVPFTHKQLFLFQEITASKCLELFLLPITSGLGRCVLTSAFTSFLLSLVSNSSSAPWNWGLYFL